MADAIHEGACNQRRAAPEVSCDRCDARGAYGKEIFVWFIELVPDEAERVRILAGVCDGSIVASMLIEPSRLRDGHRRAGGDDHGGHASAVAERDHQQAAEAGAGGDAAKRRLEPRWSLVPAVTWHHGSDRDRQKVVGMSWQPREPRTKISGLMYLHEPGAVAGLRHRLWLFDGYLNGEHRSKTSAVEIKIDMMPRSERAAADAPKRLGVQKAQVRSASKSMWDIAVAHGIERGHEETTGRVLLSRLVKALTGHRVDRMEDGELRDVDHDRREVWHNCQANLTVTTKKYHEKINEIEEGRSGAISDDQIEPKEAQGERQGHTRGLHRPMLGVSPEEAPRFFARHVMLVREKRLRGEPIAMPEAELALASGMLAADEVAALLHLVQQAPRPSPLPDGFLIPHDQGNPEPAQ